MIKLKLKPRFGVSGRHTHPQNVVIPPRWLGGPGARERLERMQRELDVIARVTGD